MAIAPWVKCKPAVATPARGKVSQPSKVSQRNHAKVSQTRRETITETMPETMEGAGAGASNADADDSVLSNMEHESYQQLAPRVQRFVGEYLIDLNAAAAYRRAYPDATEASARTLVARLLTKVGVSEAIAAAQAERARRTEVNADKALADGMGDCHGGRPGAGAGGFLPVLPWRGPPAPAHCGRSASQRGLPRPRTRFRKLGFDSFSKLGKPCKSQRFNPSKPSIDC
ncbi:terminase small subunit [Polaromonas hydrogenivorans]|uniref:Terminase small subunit n=2 Tax=Polaromonas hydrogenivorans TaxID=335476 RepID=A0AAU7LXL5_9BURK